MERVIGVEMKITVEGVVEVEIPFTVGEMVEM